MAKLLGVDNNGLYYYEDEFFKEKRADLLIVSTQDQDHVGHAIKGLEKGYDILTGASPERTSLSASVESHLMGVAAEKSRLNGGMLVKIEH